MADKLNLGKSPRVLKLGKSFDKGADVAFHSIRYDFKPASVDPTKVATVEVGSGHQVSVTVPHMEGSGRSKTVFKGSKKPYQKECVLIIDHKTGEIILEKLMNNVQLKKTRQETISKIPQSHPLLPPDQTTSQKSKKSPSQTNSQQTSQNSPPKKETESSQLGSPMKLSCSSSSSSSSSSSGSSSDSDSDQGHRSAQNPPKKVSASKKSSADVSTSHAYNQPSPPKKPSAVNKSSADVSTSHGYSQLREDLQLSESGSDCD